MGLVTSMHLVSWRRACDCGKPGEFGRFNIGPVEQEGDMFVCRISRATRLVCSECGTPWIVETIPLTAAPAAPAEPPSPR